MIFGYRSSDMVSMDMERLREKIGMFSVNQMNIYHVILEAFNIINYRSADRIQDKWMNRNERHYSNRRSQNVRVPRVDHVKCQGFTWHGARVWNQLPEHLKEMKNVNTFKDQVKKYIWENIPAY